MSLASLRANFASDRSHMVKDDGTWMAQPPAYPAIATKHNKNNLFSKWLKVDGDGVGHGTPTDAYGVEVDLAGFLALFGSA